MQAFVQLSLHSGLKAYGGSNQAQGTNTIVKEGDTFKIGQDIDVR
jgi:hydroxyacylglutathione hydrolase